MPDSCTPFDLAAFSARAESTVLAAGACALGWFRPGARTAARIDSKEGGSPVTEADYAVDALLARDLPRVFAGGKALGYVSEETVAAGDAPPREGAPFWLVDPIDGTRAYLGGDEAWSIAVALILRGRPVLAFIHAPARGLSYSARAEAGSVLNGAPLAPRRRQPSAPRVAGPHPFVERFAAGLARATIAPRIPSLALRLVAVASGGVDVAIASPGAHCWDVAAADLILGEAGAGLAEADGQALAYAPVPLRRGALVAAPAADLPTLAARLTDLRTAA